jgi:CPW-WPC domain-containing protein
MVLSALLCPMPIRALVGGRSGRTPIEEIGNMLSNSTISVAPELTSFGGPSSIIRALGRLPAPRQPFGSTRQKDPKVLRRDSCDRDYKTLCPNNFVNIGPVRGGTEQYCAADSRYHGPCRDEVYTFAKMSQMAKERWSEMCLAEWPCQRCQRDYQAFCPWSWTHIGLGKCVPSSQYEGPCRDEMNFIGYNEDMLQLWSSECGAFWSCLYDLEGADAVGLAHAASISRAATQARMRQGLQ